MKYFTITELTASQTAKSRKIDNTPSEEHKEHLVELVDNLLDPLREAWGSQQLMTDLRKVIFN